MISQGILHYDDSEGLNEEQARLAAGCVMIDAGRQPEDTGSNNVEGLSEMVSLGIGTAASVSFKMTSSFLSYVSIRVFLSFSLSMYLASTVSTAFSRSLLLEVSPSSRKFDYIKSSS